MHPLVRDEYKGCAVSLQVRVLQYAAHYAALEKDVREKLRLLAYFGSAAAYWHGEQPQDPEEVGGDGLIVRPWKALAGEYGVQVDAWDELEHWNKEDAK
jgi:hypothetical protein